MGSLEAQAPAPGVLLWSGEDGAMVQAEGLRHFGPPAQAIGVAVFVRGPMYGNRRVYVSCDGSLLMLEGAPATTWEPTGGHITDLIGAALCHGHPLLHDLPAQRT